MTKSLKLEDKDAERSILAGMLKDVSKIDKSMVMITSSEFSTKIYKNLYNVIGKIYAKHSSLLTNDLLSNLLESNGQPQEIRLRYLKVIDDIKKIKVNDAEFAFAMKSIKKAHISREMSKILSTATQKLYDKGGIEAFRVLDKKLYDLKLATINSENLIVVDTREVEDLIDRFKDMRENPDKYRGIPSGWTPLDALTSGFHPGEYVLIVAPSGGGKSMGLLNWANHAQKEGYNVAYFSFEMNHWEIRMRQLSLEAEIPYLSLKTQQLNIEQTNKQEFVLRNEIATRQSMFHIIDVPKSTVGFIEAQLRQLNKIKKIDIVFIDYLGLIKPDVHIRNRQGWEIAATISEELRELARTMGIVVVTAQQVTTEGMKKTTDDDLELGDIAISRRIADHAHTVVGLLWDKTNPNEMKLCVPKCRGGRIQSVKLWCDLDLCKIEYKNQENVNSFTPPDPSDLEV